MTEDEGKVRKLRAVRPGEPVRETAESVLPGLPRVGELDALLREVDGLRLSLETDLSLAATAVEAGSLGLARDIIDDDLDGLHRFEARALGHLSALSAEAPDVSSRAWWRRLPAAPFVAAASIVAFLLVAVPHSGSTPTDVSAATVSANERLLQISELASSGRTSQVRDAAASLHGQLLALVNQAKTDPAAAQQGLKLLSDERSIIALSGDSLALKDVLAASATLSNLIMKNLPAAIRPTVAAATQLPVAAPSTAPTQRPSAKPTSRPTTQPSSKPTTKPSAKPQPSSGSSSPSPSSDAGPVLPTGPGLQ